MTTNTDRRTRGTEAWQAAHLDAQAGVNTRAQIGLDLGVDVALDTTGLEPVGGQLDLFGGAA